HTEAQLQRADGALPAEQLRSRVRRRLLQENELTVDPEFFDALCRCLPRVSGVDIQLRRGRFHNETTQFHYDAVLRVETETAEARPEAWLDWDGDVLDLPALRRLLAGGGYRALGLRRVPNARVLPAVRAQALLAGADGATTAGEVRAAARAAAAGGVDPEDLWAVGEDLSYQVGLRWSGTGEDGTLEAMFVRPAVGGALVSYWPQNGVRSKAWEEYANNPARGGLARDLTPELREHLRRKLPDYMVPSRFVALDQFPLAPNGKVDRRALPAPEAEAVRPEREYVAPRTPEERSLAEIWEKVLRVDRVSIDDDIFELGGDSLLIFQITTRANQAGIRLAPSQIFLHPTIAALAPVITAAKSDSGRARKAPAIIPVSREAHRRSRSAL
ncbi:MAG TPA: phosphopantetheine-binding protein, partial [Blastocatellia bacterium]|nr:phosphopantetheine-binding protein [Blastocatellia bacterium]